VTEDRLHRAFHEAAALVDVEPPARRTPPFVTPVEQRPSRWLLVAAAVVVVAGGLGVVAISRNGGDDPVAVSDASTTSAGVDATTMPVTTGVVDDPAPAGPLPDGPVPNGVASPDLGAFTDVDQLVAALTDSGPLDNLTARAVDEGFAPSESICAALAQRNDPAAGSVVHQAIASFSGEHAVVLVAISTSGDARVSVYSTGTADPVTGGCRLLASAPITAMAVRPVQSSQFDVDLGDLANVAASSSLESLFVAAWDDPEWALGRDSANEIYLAGFGVSADGTIHLLDGVNRRVITVTADGLRASRAIPAAVPSDRFTGIAVASDGTEYLIALDAVIVLRDGELVARVTTDQFTGGGGNVASATNDGLWAKIAPGWRLVLGADGAAPSTPQASLPSSDPALGADRSVQISVDRPSAVVRALFPDPLWRIFTVTSQPKLDGMYVSTIVGQDVVLVGGSVEFAGQLVIVLHADGSYDAQLLDVDSGGLLESDGVKFQLVGTTLYIETAPVDMGVQVQRLDLAPLLVEP
jgi:hypothetical protein